MTNNHSDNAGLIDMCAEMMLIEKTLIKEFIPKICPSSLQINRLGQSSSAPFTIVTILNILSISIVIFDA